MIWAGHVETMGDGRKNWQRKQMPRKWREKGDPDGRTALRGTRKIKRKVRTRAKDIKKIDP